METMQNYKIVSYRNPFTNELNFHANGQVVESKLYVGGEFVNTLHIQKVSGDVIETTLGRKMKMEKPNGHGDVTLVELEQILQGEQNGNN